MHSAITDKLHRCLVSILMLGGKAEHVGPPGWGSPVSSLAEYAGMRGLGKFAEEITGRQAIDSYEYRLNGAGLKMLLKYNKRTDKVKLVICGDQEEQYPSFVAAARKLIAERGFDGKNFWGEGEDG